MTCKQAYFSFILAGSRYGGQFLSLRKLYATATWHGKHERVRRWFAELSYHERTLLRRVPKWITVP